jgi:hypothetical protein
MLVRIRVSVVDRPGSLGSVAGALGSADADIAAIDVLASESGRAIDDFLVRVRDMRHLADVCSSIERVIGVSVVGVQQPAPPRSGHADLELVGQLLAAPERGLQTLVDGLPGVLGGDWAAAVRSAPGSDEPAVVIMSMRYPGPGTVKLSATARLGALGKARIGDREPYSAGAIAPIGGSGLALLVVREHGLQFHDSEIARLGELGTIATHVVHAVTADL